MSRFWSKGDSCSKKLVGRCPVFGLFYEGLRACQLRGMRNSIWRLLNGVQRGFYRACMVYARLRGAIVNSKLAGLLGELMDRL